MDVGARKFRVSRRSLLVIVPLVTLLSGSGLWNIRQQQLIQSQRVRVLAAEQEQAARAAVESERAEARRKKQIEWAASDARVQQLYREIDNLSRINEQLLEQPVRQRTPLKKVASAGPVDGQH